MVLKFGHRGAMGYEPENTLLSFKKAMKLGVDAVELDVYVCKTGQVVIIHSNKVNRTTNGKGHVVKKTFKELRALDAGKGQKIPTLKEVLNLVNKKIQVMIELKGPDTAKPVSKIINQYIKEKGWSEEDFFVSSFRREELKKFHNICPNIKIGVLISEIPVDYAEFAEKVNAYSVNLRLDSVVQSFIDGAHQKGLKVFVWTVNSPKDIQRMKRMGVDGIFSNFPDRI